MDNTARTEHNTDEDVYRRQCEIKRFEFVATMKGIIRDLNSIIVDPSRSPRHRIVAWLSIRRTETVREKVKEITHLPLEEQHMVFEMANELLLLCGVLFLEFGDPRITVNFEAAREKGKKAEDDRRPIGDFILEEIPKARTVGEAMRAAMEKFKVGQTTARRALTEARERRDSDAEAARLSPNFEKDFKLIIEEDVPRLIQHLLNSGHELDESKQIAMDIYELERGAVDRFWSGSSDAAEYRDPDRDTRT